MRDQLVTLDVFDSNSGNEDLEEDEEDEEEEEWKIYLCKCSFWLIKLIKWIVNKRFITVNAQSNFYELNNFIDPKYTNWMFIGMPPYSKKKKKNIHVPFWHIVKFFHFAWEI